MPPVWQKGQVVSIVDETPNTKRFFISVPELNSFDFKAGQFVTLDLPIHEKPSKRWRSYSIASAPDGTNQFELLISYLEGGAGTHYLFNSVQEGTEMIFRGPLGVFQLPDQIDRDIFMICTGTGIAPFRSMTRYLLNQQVAHKQLFLLFGCRHKADLLYFDEMKQMEKDHPSFHYLPTLSREEWPGARGYVHEIYERICGDAGGPAKYPALFYLCGWKNMVNEAKQRIMGMGYGKDAIKQELYG